jgi:hypothetical protein
MGIDGVCRLYGMAVLLQRVPLIALFDIFSLSFQPEVGEGSLAGESLNKGVA